MRFTDCDCVGYLSATGCYLYRVEYRSLRAHNVVRLTLGIYICLFLVCFMCSVHLFPFFFCWILVIYVFAAVECTTNLWIVTRLRWIAVSQFPELWFALGFFQEDFSEMFLGGIQFVASNVCVCVLLKYSRKFKGKLDWEETVNFSFISTKMKR